jgi:hypothetical protein
LPEDAAFLRANVKARRALVMLFPSKPHAPQEGLVLDWDSNFQPRVVGHLSPGGIVSQAALSPDGSHALLLVAQTSATGAPATYFVATWSLEDPKEPSETARVSIPVQRAVFQDRSVALEDDAEGYAFLHNDGNSIYPEAIIRSVSQPTADLVVKMPTLASSLRFSETSRYLAVGFNVMNSQGGIIDLNGPHPTLVTQPSQFGINSRYDCVLNVLGSGHLVVADGRSRRFAIYAPTAGIPRVAVMDIGLNACGFMARDGQSVYLDLKHRLVQVDATDPERPHVEGKWLEPAGYRPLDIRGHMLFAAGPDKSLSLFRLDSAPKTEFDWHNLATVYDQVMKQYGASREFSRTYTALASLEQAGAFQAVYLPVSDLSAKKAAAIFNDIGFFASGNGGDQELSMQALRRALELDPDRAVAALNLADLLMRNIAGTVDFEQRRSLESEIAALYRQFIAHGGRPTPTIEHRIDLLASDTESAPVCQAIAQYANAGVLGDFIADKALGVPIGGHRFDVFFTTEGTAHVPTFYMYDAVTDEPPKTDPTEIEKIPWMESLWGGDALGLILYHGDPHLIHYRDTTHPVHTKSLTDDSGCEFVTTTEEHLSAKTREPELCQALIAGHGPESIEFKEPVSIARETVAERYSETGAENGARIDFANNGKPALVAQLSLDSGAGAGCDEGFFDVLNDAGDKLGVGPNHQLIAELQKLEDLKTARYPLLPCGNSPRFFRYHGLVYFEDTWPTLDAWHERHDVTRVVNGHVEDVCGMTFREHTEVVKTTAAATSSQQ